MTSLNHSGNTRFTVFIRLPCPRGDFVDPPPMEWNAAKDQALWDILSRPSKGDDLDWKALYQHTPQFCSTHVLTCLSERRADHFEVTLQFLLQQAAWLYDRQLSQVRAQMRKVPTTQSTSTSPAPGSISGSAALGQAKGASNNAPRTTSRLASQQKEPVPVPQRAPIPRRTSSTTTINQLKSAREPMRTEPAATEPKEPTREIHTSRPSGSRRDPPVPKSPTLEEEDLTSSSSESESDEDERMASRRGLRFRPFGKFSTHKPGLRDDEEEEDDSPAFLPLSSGPAHVHHHPSGPDLNATLRMNEDEPAGPRRRPTEQQIHVHRKPPTAESSTSSVSSGVPVTFPATDRRRHMHQSGGTLSPRRGPEGAPFSPRRSLASAGRETSDGTPSMGSSFSDLDDASVTQSALEEAIMSNMQHGGMASRMSTISQALRSRYLP
ncbi:multidomain presynaptic cytomatrix related protein [Aspergillus saccharolyticus JOP 1030-1]|uniref:Autophagy-related protein 29 n=1 Tax=Aspergillus saccharolyticus JOP 1030-1 TaxID=1450539 RepID=A0A318ZJV4_9EURO|nr:hypothetical protein BP01DRAFT_335402 [Aspergillus saccharolyticus JOP 1030-1]PYH47819.1 hypothetical protein BP01DRAFT_335402 [Aspergillus saccharolyticus JOP 1030-1]